MLCLNKLQQLLVMWNMISGNRLIDRKRKEEAHRRHKLALFQIRGQIDNKTPSQYNFLCSRPKAHQQKLQRQQDIQNHNSILVDKMMRSGSEIKSQYDRLQKESLNSIYRGRLQKQIDVGNQKLVKRLQSAKSQYQKIAQTSKEYIQYKSQMANSRMDPYYDLQYQVNSMPVKHHRPFSAKR